MSGSAVQSRGRSLRASRWGGGSVFGFPEIPSQASLSLSLHHGNEAQRLTRGGWIGWMGSKESLARQTMAPPSSAMGGDDQEWTRHHAKFAGDGASAEIPFGIYRALWDPQGWMHASHQHFQRLTRRQAPSAINTTREADRPPGLTQAAARTRPGRPDRQGCRADRGVIRW